MSGEKPLFLNQTTAIQKVDLTPAVKVPTAEFQPAKPPVGGARKYNSVDELIEMEDIIIKNGPLTRVEPIFGQNSQNSIHDVDIKFGSSPSNDQE